jgi:hypothetical protein
MSKPIRNRGTNSQVGHMSKRLAQLRRQLDQAQATLEQSHRLEQEQAAMLGDGLSRLGRLEEQIGKQRRQTELLVMQAPEEWSRANYTYVLGCISADMHAWEVQITSILKWLQPPKA